MLLLYYKASFTCSKLLIRIDKLVLQHVFTRQGSQVRTLYHPPVISQLNQALGRNLRCFFYVDLKDQYLPRASTYSDDLKGILNERKF